MSAGINHKGFDNQPDQACTYLADIVYSLPTLNLYVVAPKANTADTADLRLAFGPTAHSAFGIKNCTQYTPGDTVQLSTTMSTDNAPDNAALIVGPASEAQNLSVQAPWMAFGDVAGCAQSLQKAAVSALGTQELPPARNFNLPSDMLSGDSVTVSNTGVGIFYGHDLIKIQASPMAYTEYSSVQGRIRNLAEAIEDITTVSHTATTQYWGGLVRTDKRARTLSEGLGTAEYSKQPVFRQTTVEGDLSGGSLVYTILPQSSEDPVPVTADLTSYDGDRVITSAHGLEFRKTFLTPVPVETRESSMVNPLAQADYASVKPLESPSEAIPEYSYYMEAVNRQQRVQANESSWDRLGAPSGDNLSKKALDSLQIESAGTNVQYALPPVIDLTDPYTGQKRTYYATNSCIRQTSDGGIILQDGYGSEIRMSRGNIIISPATDLLQRPGRDLVSMAARNNIQIARKNTTIHSSTGTVSLYAHKDLYITGSGSGDGVTVVEDRGTGLILKSATNASLTSKEIYIGVNGLESEDAGTTKETYGNIIIDSSKGATLINGDAVGVTGKAVSVAGYSDKEASAIVLSGQDITTYGNTLSLAAKSTVVASAQNSVEVTIPADGTTRSTPTGGSGTLSVQGAVELSEGLTCAGVLSAAMVQATAGTFSNASDESGLFSKVTLPKTGTPTPVMLSASTTDAVQNLKAGAYQDSYVVSNRLVYPDSEGWGLSVTDESGWPEMRWQKMLKDKKYWKEPDMVDPLENSPSKVYPGAALWESLSLVDGDTKSTAVLGTDYVINTED